MTSTHEPDADLDVLLEAAHDAGDPVSIIIGERNGPHLGITVATHRVEPEEAYLMAVAMARDADRRMAAHRCTCAGCSGVREALAIALSVYDHELDGRPEGGFH